MQWYGWRVAGHCDAAISILDRNAKGNTKDSEAVAKAMVAQGAWRRLFNELRENKALGLAVDRVLKEQVPKARAEAIDRVYELNAGKKNYLTGPSCNVLGAFMAAFDPENNLSVISLNDRLQILEAFGGASELDRDGATVGSKMVESNELIQTAAQSLGLPHSARTISLFFYAPEVKELWREQHKVKLPEGDLTVSVPTTSEEEEALEGASASEVSDAMKIQAELARIGAAMGFRIWLPKNDRSRVLKAWDAKPGELLESLPLAFDKTTMATIEQIDVLWLSHRSIVRAFEVEHTTSIYSGLLRMADLVALQPNINVKLHIVASPERKEKVLREIRRPVFSLMQGLSLRNMCTYLSYDSVQELGKQQHLEHLSESVLKKYEESAEADDGPL